MTNSQDIFAIALGLQKPWHIESVSFNEDTSRLDIHLAFIKGHKFKGEDENLYTVHDNVERSWQHLNFFQHHCYLHAKVPGVSTFDVTIF